MNCKLTHISGATDMLFENGLRVWWPPNGGEPYFSQPAGWCRCPLPKPIKLPKLTKEQRKTIRVPMDVAYLAAINPIFTPVNLTQVEIQYYGQFLS